MRYTASGPLLLALIFSSAFQSGPAGRMEAGYRLHGAVGGTTMAALSAWRELQKAGFSDTLASAQLDTLQQVLNRASSSRHWQQKLGGRYAAVELIVARQSVPLLVSESGRLVVLLDKLGRSTVAPGRNYFIEHTADQIWLRRLASAATSE